MSTSSTEPQIPASTLPPPDSAWSSREILEAMLASAPIAIVMVDAKGLILYAGQMVAQASSVNAKFFAS